MFEQLESRRLMSASAFQVGIAPALGGGSLRIDGTGGPDVIEVYRVADSVVVEVNGLSSFYASAAVNSIQINGLGGHDWINANDSDLDQTFTIMGGAGHDTIHGGPNADLIYGG